MCHYSTIKFIPRPAPNHQKASVAPWLCVGRYWYGSTAKTQQLTRERVRSHLRTRSWQTAFAFIFSSAAPNKPKARQRPVSTAPVFAKGTQFYPSKELSAATAKRQNREAQGVNTRHDTPTPPTIGFRRTGVKTGTTRSAPHKPRFARAAASSQGK